MSSFTASHLLDLIKPTLITSNKWEAVKDDIQAVLTACHGVPLKVILETCLLTKEEIVKACEICKALGVALSLIHILGKPSYKFPAHRCQW